MAAFKINGLHLQQVYKPETNLISTENNIPYLLLPLNK